MSNQLNVQIELMPEYDTKYMPAYMTGGAAGMDLCMNGIMSFISIKPGKRVLIPTGIKMAIPDGYEAQIRPRSGLSLKTDLMVVNSPGTIDSDYRGEIKVIMGNFGSEQVTINRGDRIAQVVFAPVIRANLIFESLNDTERGTGGFGSTGI
jgi:dUTP pyrophosphatase